MMICKFVEQSSTAGEWSDVNLVWFWHDANPYTAKYALEKLTRILMERDVGDAQHLRYCGMSTTGDHTCSVLLRFEAVIQGRNLYSLCVRASAQRKQLTEEAFLKTARRTLPASPAWWSRFAQWIFCPASMVGTLLRLSSRPGRHQGRSACSRNSGLVLRSQFGRLSW